MPVMTVIHCGADEKQADGGIVRYDFVDRVDRTNDMALPDHPLTVLSVPEPKLSWCYLTGGYV